MPKALTTGVRASCRLEFFRLPSWLPAIRTSGALSMAAIGAQTLGSLSSGGGGGGSIGSISTGSASAASVRSEPDFVQDTEVLQLTDSTASGSGTNEIRFATDSGDELVDAIANALNKGQREGRF